MPHGQDTRADVIAALTELAGERQSGPVGAEQSAFLAAYYADSDPDDLARASVVDLYGAALGHRTLVQRASGGGCAVRVVTPSFDLDGWSSRHTVVQVAVEDMPFVVDSIHMTITGAGLGIHVLHHPVIDGVSLVHVDVDRIGAERAAELQTSLESALADVRAAVTDWAAMRDDIEGAVAELQEQARDHISPLELHEAVAFLRWLADDHFTFLGVRSYELDRDEHGASVRRVPGTGLGILRAGDDKAPTRLSAAAARLAQERAPLTLTKANARATVHRPAQLDYIGVRRFDADGNVIGERRYLGLFGSRMYTTSATEIPLLRRKVEMVLEGAGYAPGSHSARSLLSILETFPRDELVQAHPDLLRSTVVAIHQLQERRRTRLFLRCDAYARYWSVLVYLPRDRYNTTTRLATERILLDALDGTEIAYEARVSESALARLHYVVRAEVPNAVGVHARRREDMAHGLDIDALEARIAAAIRDWDDDLQDLLIDERGEDEGLALAHRYRGAFSAGYRAEHPAQTAVRDIERLEGLGEEDIAFHLYRRPESAPEEFRLRVYRRGPDVLVSDLVPPLEHLGGRVTDQRPHRLRAEELGERHVYDMGMQMTGPVDVASIGSRVVDTLDAVWAGRTSSDRLHELVLSADVTWREAAVLRAYSRYLRQIGIPFSPEYVESCIVAHPDIAKSLMAYFHTRFDLVPDDAAADELDQWIVGMLDDVASLDEDRILRTLLAMVRATLRTNVHQIGDDGHPKSYLAFKLDPAGIPDLPLPRPHREIFVHSPRVEGVHLRGAAVARGGLRWSDRQEDYRTEVLGLMKAQMVKNAVIVPAGAKGGFVVKQPPADPVERRDEVVACYRTFVSGLLDLTDNLVGDEVVPPSAVARHDGDDPYLVVAADKGTATFSDIANGVAAEYGYWLGDAFASGGSAGYDHKDMGITARGAWESVKRHFRELDIDVQRDPVSVVGIGDMGGDVFGNGMLLSTMIKLVGAFDHRHVFLDPDPDPSDSYRARAMLFERAGSTWDDYDREALSRGGGVFSRDAKSIPLSPEIRDVLCIDAEELTPNGLISAMLRAPVDLLWNGGIGTYVKASSETHAEVGDKANDAVRVDGAQLRCRVIGEGGNLGLTQRGRVEFALHGGRVNTDAIDNSAGVDCSDHEVNIKIVVDAAVRDGDLTAKQRDELLADMTDEVADLVLADNVRQNQALVNAVVQAPSLIDVHQRYVRMLETSGRLDREVEFLPSDEEFAERKASGHGLTTPELAVLLAYTKNLLAEELLAGALPDDSWCDRLALAYFPRPLQTAHAERIRGHRLRREIVATTIANEVVDHQGITSLYRVRDETGASADDASRAMLVAARLFDIPDLRTRIALLDHRVAAAVQTRMLLDARKLAERGARWLIRHRFVGSVHDLIERFGAGASAVAASIPALLTGSELEAFRTVADELREAGVPADLAERVAGFEPMLGALDCVELAQETDEAPVAVAGVLYRLEEDLGLGWLLDQVIGLPRDNRWQSLARLSMREDLHAQIRRLTGLVIAATEPSLAPAERVAEWVAGREQSLARLEHVMADIRATGSADLATLSVGLREVTQLG